MTLLYEGPGDIFHEDVDVTVVPVNTMGVMGAGIALYVKRKYPFVFKIYKDAVRRGALKIGKPYHMGDYSGKRFLFFPTKEDWRKPSKLSYIEQTLDYMDKHYKECFGDWVLGFPPLGCGYGNLDYVKQVGPLLRERLSKAPYNAVILLPDN